ncbi:hypothetical protein [Paenibacillus eucommiae]|uniref:Beta-hexosaminidase bacterial type N-terminal domain-containing protein n=1 Tax=Paenibacillus eucommiae TaxID=1355755 RepID=A0ABS4IVT8_9BACL|nr:hypothetical protein [Paenibacillus eucommiae]MBP1990956.1 hypothetical protein [Paenibacillus eucommiae]
MLELFRDSKGKTALQLPHFPTQMQAIVWRNWGLVPVGHIAKVLRTNAEQVALLAEGMGLSAAPEVNPLWLSRGYITIIRANWHLLTYEQLLILLDWTEEQLVFALKEDDFLWYKLGLFKPEIEEIYYRSLLPEEKEQTEQLRQRIVEHFPSGVPVGLPGDKDKAFGFLDRFKRADPIETYTTPQPSDWKEYEVKLGEIKLDASWTITYPTNGKHVKDFIDQFVRKMKKNWGIDLRAFSKDEERQGQTGEYSLQLQIEPHTSVLAESHEIHVLAKTITVKAVDEPGLLKGLQWMAKQMDERGGPLLQQGYTKRLTKFDLRYIYSYSAVFGDPLIDPELDPNPDGLLEALSELGVNGIWLHCVLYNLIPWKEAPELSQDWEKRLEGLRRLTERAAKYGIGIYLYFNEPRGMALPFFDQHPDWKGATENGVQAALCTSRPEIQQYIRESTASLFREVPELAGLFTITMSENLTNCYSRTFGNDTECPRCSQRKASEIVAEVNRCIAEGAFSVKPDARIICWTWGWDSFSEEMLLEAIEQLPDGVRLMCVSEELMPTNIADTKGIVRDYSISIVGPGERSKTSWEAANRRGLQTMAKVQLNNSWECSAVPYLPVLDIIEEHLDNLSQSGVSGLMLSWTLGGYPSPNLELASEYYWETTRSNPAETNREAAGQQQVAPGKNELLKRKFGRGAFERVSKAISQLSEAFREFPFHCGTLYVAPQNYGPSNKLHLTPTGYTATMVGFPYDNLEAWKSVYTADRFEEQFQLLSQKWKKGMDQLGDAEPYIAAGGHEAYTELVNAAWGAYYHFRSTALQISFVIKRDLYLQEEDASMREKQRGELLTIIDEEIGLAKALYELVGRDSRIGYEATNHYYYTRQDLQEKVLNCLHIKALLS